MVKTIDLRIRDCFVAALITAVCFFLSFPILDYWYFSFLSYAVFSFFYINLGQKKSLKAIKIFFTFSLLFWFVKRSIMFESIFATASNYFQNRTQGISFTLLLFFLLAIYSAFLSTLTLVFIQQVRNNYLKYLLIVISLVVTTELNDIYLPVPAERIILQNDLLRASLNVFHPYYYKFGYYLSALLLALSFGKLKKSIKSLAIISAWLIFSGSVGYMVGQKANNPINPKMNIILVQSHQSVLNPSSYILEDYLKMVNKEIEQKFPSEKEVYIFWPESFMEQSEYNMSLLNRYQKKSPVQQVHIIGTYTLSEKGIINKMILVSPAGSILSEYFKNHLFPIGEKSLEIPLMPSSWTKANVPVLDFDEVTTLNHNDKTFLPLICYESVIDTHYDKINSLKNHEHFNIMVNISKDSFYENTSLIELHSLYSKVKSSILKLPMIRVSTTAGTEVISSTGLTLASSKPGTLNITSYVLR